MKLEDLDLAAIASLLQEEIALEEQTLAAEAEVLAKLVEHIKPLLRTIDYPIATSRCDAQYGSREEKDLRGLILADRFELKSYIDDQDRGEYKGNRLLLLRSGELRVQQRQGEWSQWQGETSRWNSEIADISLEDAVKTYTLEEIADGILKDIHNAIEGAKEKKEKLSLRVEKLTRICAILE